MEYNGDEISENELYEYEELPLHKETESDDKFQKYLEDRIRWKEIGESYI